MKQFLVFVLIFVTPDFTAQNNVRLFSVDGEGFKATSARKFYNNTPQPEVLIERLLTDTLKVTIEFEKSGKQEIKLYLLDKGKPTTNKEFLYKLSIDKGKIKTKYLGFSDIVPLPDPLIPKEPVVDTMTAYRNSTLGHLCKLNGGKPQFFNNIPKNTRCTKPMPGEYITYAQSLISKGETEAVRVKYCTEICENNCLSVSQLSKILTFIDYELEKLKLVRVAYFNLVDTLNRGELYKNFRFESSLKELSNFFRNTGAYKPYEFSDCKGASTTKEMDDLIAKLKLYGNDVRALEVLKSEYARYCFLTNSVVKLLQVFVHDRERLDAAKLLYFYCLDKEKFLETYSVFSYKETASELNEFINKQKEN